LDVLGPAIVFGHACVVVEDPVRVVEHVLQLVALEDVVVAAWFVARPVLRVHGASDGPRSALHALDPHHDALLAARVVEPVELPFGEARRSRLLAHGARIQSPRWDGSRPSSVTHSPSCSRTRARRTASPRI